MPDFIGSDDVVVIIGGNPFIGWIDVSVTQSFDKAVGEGRVTMTELPDDPFPARIGDTAIVMFGRKPVLTGMVFSIDADHDHDTHTITLTLRDRTQDLVDSTLGPGIESKPPVTLQEVAQTTISKMGLGIGVVDKCSPEPYQPAEVPVGDIELGGLQYLDNWAQKRQCLFNTDGRGNLVIDRNQGRGGPGQLRKTRDMDDPRNNVLKARYKNSLQDRHHMNATSAQKSTNDQRYWESQEKGVPEGQAKPLSTEWGYDMDTSVPASRRKHTRARAGVTKESPRKASRWRSNIAKGRGFQYIATVQGFEATPGTLWWHGVTVPVIDEHFLIADTLFVVQVKFMKSLKGGATTEVVCTFRDAFSMSGGSGGSGGGRGSKPGIGTMPPGSFSSDVPDEFLD